MVDATLPRSVAEKSDPRVVAPISNSKDSHSKEKLPAKMRIVYEDAEGNVLETRVLTGTPLRYGENPDQRAAIFELEGQERKEILGKKAVSYNNEGDTDRAFALVEELDRALPLLRSFGETGTEIVAVIKHKVASGLSIAHKQVDAYDRAFATDMSSAFGGIIATNTIFKLETMEALINKEFAMNGEKTKGHFVECIIAPGFEDGVLERMQKRSRTQMRLIPVPNEWAQARETLYSHFELRSLLGDRILLQDPDSQTWGPPIPWNVVSKRQPTDYEVVNWTIAWIIVHQAPSNAVAYVSHSKLAGIAAGSQKRSDAAWIAGDRAIRNSAELLRANFDEIDLKGTVVATDGFCPFPDTIEEAHKYGATAIIAPHGGKRDQEVIDKADSFDMAVGHTEKRTFKH